MLNQWFSILKEDENYFRRNPFEHLDEDDSFEEWKQATYLSIRNLMRDKMQERQLKESDRRQIEKILSIVDNVVREIELEEKSRKERGGKNDELD